MTDAGNPPDGQAGRHPPLARVLAFLLVPLYLVGMGATVWTSSRLDAGQKNVVEDVVIMLGFCMFAVVGALLLAKRPENVVGWILGGVVIMVAVFPAAESHAALVMTTSGEPDWIAVFGAWANGWYWFVLLSLAFIYLPLYFPDGRLPSRRWRPVVVIVGVGTLVAVVLGMLADTLRGQDVDYRIENPIGVEGLAHVEDMPAVMGVLGVVLGIGCVGAVAAVVVRFRRSRGVERQQMKWFVFATAPIVTFPIGDSLPGIVGALIFGWMLVGLPAAIGVAVLKYRLYDVDVVINRTLVYGSLTACLALVYLGSVVGLQRLLAPLVGEGNNLSIVASTLLIAALFGPLRRRVQSFIDRRFYRRKYDAAKILAAFGTKLRDEIELDALNEELLTVVNGTMQPAHASLWLRGPDGKARP